MSCLSYSNKSLSCHLLPSLPRSGTLTFFTPAQTTVSTAPTPTHLVRLLVLTVGTSVLTCTTYIRHILSKHVQAPFTSHTPQTAMLPPGGAE